MAEILSGDLTSLRLIDILRVLNLNVKTGRLNLMNRTDVGEIYFKSGEIVHALYQTRVGEDAVYGLLAWSRGSFVFSPSITVEEKTITTTTKEILARGDAIDKEWDAIRDVIPSPETVFGATTEPPPDFHLSELEAEILRQTNGNRTVIDITERVQRSELEVSQVIRKLFLLGLVEPAGKMTSLALESIVDTTIFDVMQSELTKVVGPMAPIILDEQIERMGEDREFFPKRRLAELGELVSREIPSESKQVRFQQIMVQLLKKV